ncbi:PLP-dependent aminotransferase family protein [Thermodesulfobacteriota bacterium]
MDTDAMLREYRIAGRIRREHIWFLYPGLRWRFEEIEAMGTEEDNTLPVGSEINCRRLLSKRTKKMGVNRIREILKVLSQPGMVSLAGGIPSPESFPMETIKLLTARVMNRYGSKVFQYDVTEGFYPLREALSNYVRKKGIHASAEEILISSGSQGVLDTLGKILISRGDRIALEEPTYLGALQAFAPYEPKYARIKNDENGPIPGSIEKLLHSKRIKFIYLVPTFQNPTGRSIPLDRRMEIARIIKGANALLVEDDPYSDLRYRGNALQTIKSLAPENVVHVGTLSKIFAPGLRVGFCVAPGKIHQWMVLAKQGVDLHTATLSQALAAEYLAGGHLEAHLPKILDLYGPKAEAMLNALDRFFPESFKWSRPEGGMFIWAEGPQGLDTEKIYREAIKENTAFVPGRFFYMNKRGGKEAMRLNFTMASEKEIEQAVKTLSMVIRREL